MFGHFQKRFEELEDLLSIELSERHARLDEADMDQFDYSNGASESTDVEPTGASESAEPSEETEAASEDEPESEAEVVTAEAQEDAAEEETPSEIDDAEASAEDGIEENVPA